MTANVRVAPVIGGAAPVPGRCPAWSLPEPLSPHDSRAVHLELGITGDDRDALDEPLRNDEAVERVAMVEWQLGHPGRVYPFDGQDDEPGRDLVVEIVVDGLRKREPAETRLDRPGGSAW